MSTPVDALHSLIQNMGKIAVALSGGLDSSVLLSFAASVLGKENCLAITVKTPYMMEMEMSDASDLCEQMGIRRIELELPIPSCIKANPANRCYLCKKELFTKLKTLAAKEGFPFLADGTNLDDLGDHRPGMKALAELKILSPFKEARLGKDSIRMLASRLGLDTSIIEKPAYACLLTRLEHDTDIDEALLRRIDEAETYLRDFGLPSCRVRVHGSLARIEIPVNMWQTVLRHDTASRICTRLSHLGFDPVTLDLAGYKRGSMNPKNGR